MSKTEHTPGPWQARGFGDDCDVIKAPECLADRYAPIIICECKQDARTENEVSADALLIAAAPDLLEAAKASEQCIMDFLELYKNGGTMLVMDEAVKSLKSDALKSVRAAIAKAECK